MFGALLVGGVLGLHALSGEANADMARIDLCRDQLVTDAFAQLTAPDTVERMTAGPDGTAIQLAVPGDDLAVPDGVIVAPGAGMRITRESAARYRGHLIADFSSGSASESIDISWVVDRELVDAAGRPIVRAGSGGSSMSSSGVLVARPLNVICGVALLVGVVGLLSIALTFVVQFFSRPPRPAFAVPIGGDDDA